MNRELMHREIYLVTESLHRRAIKLECSLGESGAFSVKPILDQTESILNMLDKIQNYEKTIQSYISRFEKIMNMCKQKNPDWLAIMSEIIDVLSGEDVDKNQRDGEIISIMEKNLETLDIMQQLAKEEIARIRSPNWDPLSANASVNGDVYHNSQFTIGVSYIEAVQDVKNVLRMAIQYKKTIESITVKFQIIKKEIQYVRWDAPAIVNTALRIIQVIQEEDIVKKQREDSLLKAMKQITTTFQEVTLSIVNLKQETRKARAARQTVGWGAETSLSAELCLSRDISLDDEMRLGEPFSFVLNTLGQVLGGVNAIINHQKTIADIYKRYQAFLDELRYLATISDIRDVIPCLLRLIKILKEEDNEKMQRDLELISSMKMQNNAVRDLTNDLGNMGYEIV